MDFFDCMDDGDGHPEPFGAPAPLAPTAPERALWSRTMHAVTWYTINNIFLLQE